MMDGRREKCLKLMLQGNLKDKEIAELINVTPKTISAWKKEQEFQDAYNRGIRDAFLFAVSKAFRKQVSLLNSRSDMVAHLAAKDIMDRAGFTADSNVKVDVNGGLNISFSGEDELED